MTLVKICGIKTVEHGLAAARAGVDMIGIVFVPKSPRALSPEQASNLVTDIKHACYDEGFAMPDVVGLFVDAGEKLLAETAPFVTAFQLHGHEDPERVAELADDFGQDLIKAIPVGDKVDWARVGEFAEVSDMLLFDAQPPRGADLTGGNGVAFDWSLLSNYGGATSFLLAGGLSPENVEDAIASARRHTAFAGVDVSSGVEASPGQKDSALIVDFIRKAKAGESPEAEIGSPDPSP